MLRRWGAEQALVVLTRDQLKQRIRGVVERLYGLAYSQEVVVGVVAGPGGVVGPLLFLLPPRRRPGPPRAGRAPPRPALPPVLAEATLMGILGTALGLLLGIPLEWYCVQVILVEEAGFVFPVLVPWREAAIIAGISLGIATLAGLGPALRTLQLRIPEAIAYE